MPLPQKTVGRAAGQPIFFIVGGLIAAAILSLLGTLGFIANKSDNDLTPTPSVESAEDHEKPSAKEN